MTSWGIVRGHIGLLLAHARKIRLQDGWIVFGGLWGDGNRTVEAGGLFFRSMRLEEYEVVNSAYELGG